MEIGKRIYYDKLTGNVILDTGERAGNVTETTPSLDFETYAELAERVPETVGHIQLKYGQYAQDFAECSGYRVNPVSLALEFSYPDPSNPEPVYQKPLSEQVAELKAEKAALESRVAATEDSVVALMDTILMLIP